MRIACLVGEPAQNLGKHRRVYSDVEFVDNCNASS